MCTMIEAPTPLDRELECTKNNTASRLLPGIAKSLIVLDILGKSETSCKIQQVLIPRHKNYIRLALNLENNIELSHE